MVVLTASAHSLPNSDLLQMAHTITLSNVATSLTEKLPRDMWMDDVPSFHHQLQFVLATIPEAVLTECQALPGATTLIVFALAVLHTTLASTGSHPPPHFSNLLAAIMHLLSTTRASVELEVVLASVQGAVRDIYIHCSSHEEINKAITRCLSPEAVVPSTLLVPKEGVEIVLPSGAVSPSLYWKHVTGLIPDSRTHPCR